MLWNKLESHGVWTTGSTFETGVDYRGRARMGSAGHRILDGETYFVTIRAPGRENTFGAYEPCLLKQYLPTDRQCEITKILKGATSKVPGISLGSEETSKDR